MYAVIETGGKQYRVQEGDVITVEKLDAKAGDKVTFDKVIFKYKAKKDYRKKQGHRQPYTMVKIESLGTGSKKAEPVKEAPKAEAKEEIKEAKPAKKVSASMKKDELITFAKTT